MTLLQKVLATDLSILHNYFDDLNKIIFKISTNKTLKIVKKLKRKRANEN